MAVQCLRNAWTPEQQSAGRSRAGSAGKNAQECVVAGKDVRKPLRRSSGNLNNAEETVPDCLSWLVPSPRHTIPPSSSAHWMTRTSKWKKMWFPVVLYMFSSFIDGKPAHSTASSMLSVPLKSLSQRTEPSHSAHPKPTLCFHLCISGHGPVQWPKGSAEIL